jgi:hypothetical protein
VPSNHIQIGGRPEENSISERPHGRVRKTSLKRSRSLKFGFPGVWEALKAIICSPQREKKRGAAGAWSIRNKLKIRRVGRVCEHSRNSHFELHATLSCSTIFGLDMKVQTRDEFEGNKEPQWVDRASWDPGKSPCTVYEIKSHLIKETKSQWKDSAASHTVWPVARLI